MTQCSGREATKSPPRACCLARVCGGQSIAVGLPGAWVWPALPGTACTSEPARPECRQHSTGAMAGAQSSAPSPQLLGSPPQTRGSSARAAGGAAPGWPPAGGAPTPPAAGRKHPPCCAPGPPAEGKGEGGTCAEQSGQPADWQAAGSAHRRAQPCECGSRTSRAAHQLRPQPSLSPCLEVGQLGCSLLQGWVGSPAGGSEGSQELLVLCRCMGEEAALIRREQNRAQPIASKEIAHRVESLTAS